jgi:nucleoside-diphosphate-sugar epimerase
MTSDGTPWRPLVHVLDIGEAMAATLEAPAEAVCGEIFNVGDSGQNYRVREIATIVGDIFPEATVTFGKSDSDNRSYRVSFDKIHRHLPGFRCGRDAVTGARELRALFERIGMAPETFRFRAYTRLKQLDHLLATRQVDGRLNWRAA